MAPADWLYGTNQSRGVCAEMKASQFEHLQMLGQAVPTWHLVTLLMQAVGEAAL